MKKCFYSLYGICITFNTTFLSASLILQLSINTANDFFNYSFLRIITCWKCNIETLTHMDHMDQNMTKSYDRTLENYCIGVDQPHFSGEKKNIDPTESVGCQNLNDLIRNLIESCCQPSSPGIPYFFRRFVNGSLTKIFSFSPVLVGALLLFFPHLLHPCFVPHFCITYPPWIYHALDFFSTSTYTACLKTK